MQKLAHITRFVEAQNIILEGFDPISAGGFTQVPNVILNDATLSFGAKVVYAKLLSYAWHNNHVFPGQDTMAGELGSSQPTVARAISELEKRGLLEITRRGQGKTNLYVLKYTIQQKKRG
jgi:DNA-binding MarR family transcriptional regulator